jgi:hypothetical protein
MVFQTPSGSHSGARREADIVMFHRTELDRILRVYGLMVAGGEWKDYAIDGLKDRAEFSIFRNAAEFPVYRIVKTPADARRQGAWKVIGAGGVILKRGQDLTQVLKVFDRQIAKLNWRSGT